MRTTWIPIIIAAALLCTTPAGAAAPKRHRSPSAIAGLQAQINRVAKRVTRGQTKTLLFMPSNVYMVPPTKILVDSKGKLQAKRGYGEAKPTTLDKLMPRLYVGELAHGLARFGQAVGKTVNETTVKQLEKKLRGDNLSGLLGQLGITAKPSESALDGTLRYGQRLAKKQVGSSRLARIPVGQSSRATNYDVLEVSRTGQLVTYRIEDIQVGESKQSEPKPIGIAAARSAFPGVDIKAKVSSKLGL